MFGAGLVNDFDRDFGVLLRQEERRRFGGLHPLPGFGGNGALEGGLQVAVGPAVFVRFQDVVVGGDETLAVVGGVHDDGFDLIGRRLIDNPFPGVKGVDADDFQGNHSVRVAEQLDFRLGDDDEPVIPLLILEVAQLEVPIGGDVQHGEAEDILGGAVDIAVINVEKKLGSLVKNLTSLWCLSSINKQEGYGSSYSACRPIPHKLILTLSPGFPNGKKIISLGCTKGHGNEASMSCG